MCNALILSQYNTRVEARYAPISHKIYVSQASSTVVEAIDLYSTFVLDLATVGCFFALQEIRLLPRNVQ